MILWRKNFKRVIVQTALEHLPSFRYDCQRQWITSKHLLPFTHTHRCACAQKHDITHLLTSETSRAPFYLLITVSYHRYRRIKASSTVPHGFTSLIHKWKQKHFPRDYIFLNEVLKMFVNISAVIEQKLSFMWHYVTIGDTGHIVTVGPCY